MTEKQKFINSIFEITDGNIEAILFAYMNEYRDEFSASRINTIIKRLQEIYLADSINRLEHIREVAKERATYLGAYLEGNLYTDEETARRCVTVQLENANAIIQACDMV